MKKNSMLPFLQCALSVCLFVLAQPGFVFKTGCAFFAWFAYIPLFLFLDSASIRRSVASGFFYGAVSYFFFCFWLSSYGVVAISFVCFLFATYYALLFFLIAFAKRYMPPRCERFFWLVRCCIFLTVEYVRTRGVFGFSYGIIGYTQWRNPVFLKFARLFGIWGVSFIIMLVNSLCAQIIAERSISKRVREIRLCLSLLLALHLFYGISDVMKNETKSRTLKIALIQNASSADSASLDAYERDVFRLEALTDAALRLYPDIQLIVWPETAVVPDIFYYLNHPRDRQRHELSLQVTAYIKTTQKSFIVGNSYFDGSETHNSALYFDSVQKNVAVYSKNHLVPFTEYWPKFLDFPCFEPIKTRLNCDFFTAGTDITVFSFDSTHFCVPICFEDSFAPFVRKMKQSGADFFVNISDDAWAHSRAAQNIHLSMSVFRSAECAVPFVRSTIDGVTCVINENGAVTEQLESGTDDFLVSDVAIPAHGNTMYVLLGDFCVIVLSCLTGVLLLILSIRFVKVRLLCQKKIRKRT